MECNKIEIKELLIRGCSPKVWKTEVLPELLKNGNFSIYKGKLHKTTAYWIEKIEEMKAKCGFYNMMERDTSQFALFGFKFVNK